MWLPHLCQQWGMWDYSRCALSCSPTRSYLSKPPALNLPKHCLLQQLLFWSQNQASVDQDWGGLRRPLCFPRCNSSSSISTQKTVWMMNLICTVFKGRCARGLLIQTTHSIYIFSSYPNFKIPGLHSMQMSTASSKCWLCTFMRQSAGLAALALTHLPFIHLGAERLKWVCSW